MESLLFSRTNPVLSARAGQLVRNLAALKGGRPYIDLRLWRAPNESNLSWFGAEKPGATPEPGCVSRRDRACLINDCGRVAGKIAQYLFSQQTARPGIDAEWAKSVTATNQSITMFWMAVCDAFTAGQWCWLQADRGRLAIDPATGQPVPRTILDRERSGDHVVWTLWTSLDVPDWSFDAQGNLLWLITVEKTLDNADPLVPAREVITRTLWRRGVNGGDCTWQQFQRGKAASDDKPAEDVLVDSGTIPGCPEIPFVLVGAPSKDPWWFDELEMMQAQTMNLDSLHIENLVGAAFPQIIISKSTYENLESHLLQVEGLANGKKITEVVKELVRGLNNPIVEAPEDKGLTRFISGSQTDLTALPNEEARKRQIFFDQAGLALFNKESRQVQSAESKQFDHLDTESTLGQRAALLQTAEERLVAASVAMDETFAAYEPSWPTQFNVSDPVADGAALSTLVSMPVITLTQRKVAAKVISRLLATYIKIPDDMMTEIDREIDGMTEEDFTVPGPFGPTRDNDDDDNENKDE